MTRAILFAHVDPGGGLFAVALRKYLKGEVDRRTIEKL